MVTGMHGGAKPTYTTSQGTKKGAEELSVGVTQSISRAASNDIEPFSRLSFLKLAIKSLMHRPMGNIPDKTIVGSLQL